MEGAGMDGSAGGGRMDANERSAVAAVMASLEGRHRGRGSAATSRDTGLPACLDATALAGGGRLTPDQLRRVAHMGLSCLARELGLQVPDGPAEERMTAVARQLSTIRAASPPTRQSERLSAMAPPAHQRPSAEDVEALSRRIPGLPAWPSAAGGDLLAPISAAPPSGGAGGEGPGGLAGGGPARRAARAPFRAAAVNYLRLSGTDSMVSTATGGTFASMRGVFERLEASERALSEAEMDAEEARDGAAHAGAAGAAGATGAAGAETPEEVALGDLFPEGCVYAGPGATFSLARLLATGVTVWRSRGEDRRAVPRVDPDFRFPQEVLATLVTARRTRRNPVLVGPTGCGKSTLLRQFAARLRLPYFRIPVDGEMRRREVIGGVEQRTSPEGSYTAYREGMLVRAFRMPSLVNLDELDRADPDLMYAAHEALEGESLTLPEDGGRLVARHEGCMMAGASNTRGGGDPMGLYAAKTTMSEASRDRMTYWVDVDYLPADEEARLIRCGNPAIGERVARLMAGAAEDLRKLLQQEKIRTACSTRALRDAAADMADRATYSDLSEGRLARDAMMRIVAGRAVDDADRAAIERAIDTRLPVTL